MSSKTIILGSSGAGKTSLVAAIQAAAQAPSPDRIRVAVIDASEPTNLLWTKFNSMVLKSGACPQVATENVQGIDFILGVEKRPLISLGSSPPPTRAVFQLLDVPGGMVLGDILEASEQSLQPFQQEMLDKILEHMRTASSAIICVNINESRAANNLFIYLPNLILRAGIDSLRWSRVAVILTRCDEFVLKTGQGAVRLLEDQMDPATQLFKYSGESVWRQLRQQMPEAEFAVGWSSIYGFLPDGSANYNSETQGLLASGPSYDPRHTRDNWQPYNVLDPFIFCATGDRRSLKRFKPKA